MQSVEKLEVVEADITRLEVDAIVNAANERLLGGGGVDGAIHRAAGPELLAACRAHPEVSPGVRCPTGSCRLTPGFRLPARFVIHTVGPVWQGGGQGESEKLAACYRACLELAAQERLRSVAFPAISCGVYGYPLGEAARLASQTVVDCLSREGSIAKVLFVAFGAPVAAELRRAVARITA